VTFALKEFTRCVDLKTMDSAAHNEYPEVAESTPPTAGDATEEAQAVTSPHPPGTPGPDDARDHTYPVVDPKVDAALERVMVNKIEVLSNRLVPGSDGSIEHVVVANNAVTVIRSTPLRGRVRITKDNILVGGVSCKILLTGLEARVDTVRHLVGGESTVHGALFLSKQRDAPVKMFGGMAVGSPKSVIQYLIESHCAAQTAENLTGLAQQLDGMFMPFEKLSHPAA